MPLLQGREAKYGIGRIGFMPLLQGAEAKYGIIFKMFFFSLINPIFEEKKKRDKYKFLWLSLLFKHFFLLKFSRIWVSKKRNDIESIICLKPRQSQKKIPT